MAEGPGSVRIRLTTRDEDVKVDDSPIYVPVDLKRYGLSEIVNQLLGTTEPVPFDFLIDGSLLRTSLEKYLTSNGLSTESVVTLEYVRSALPPSFLSSYSHDDWVSSVHINRDAAGNVATGCYDGIVRIWDQSGKVVKQLAGHNAAVKGVKWLGSERLVSAGADRILCLWKLGEAEETNPRISCIFSGHTAAVNDVVALRGGTIVSASSDCTLKVWTSKTKDLPPPPKAPASKFTSTQKRKKLAEQALASSRVRGSLSTLEGHTAPVTAVSAHATEPGVVYSVSEDHSIRTWDLVTSQLIDTKTASFALLSCATMGPVTSLLACGSSARHILLHDPRATLKTSQGQLVGHKNFVVSLAPSPKNPYQLVSGSHDGTCRLWDVRANKSLATLEASGDEEKDVYCVDWAQNIAFGGRNKKLEFFDPHE